MALLHVDKTLTEGAVFLSSRKEIRKNPLESGGAGFIGATCYQNIMTYGLLRGFRTVVSVDFLCCEDVLLVSVVDVVGPLVAKR